eukprot:gene6380-7390_t
MDPLEELSRASRSVRVSIHNSSSKKLILKSHPITSGQWKVPPPDTILPLSTVEFGSESSGMLSGTEAGAVYVADGSDAQFEFNWNNPMFGKRGFRRVTPPNYECDYKVVDVNNCILSFTVKELDSGFMRDIDEIESEIKTLTTLMNEADVQLKEGTIKEKTKHLEDMKKKKESLQQEIETIKKSESDPKLMEQNLSKIREAIESHVKARKGMEHMREVYEKTKDLKSMEGLDKQIETKKSETEALRKKEQKVIQRIIELKKALGIGGTGVPARKRVQAIYAYERTSEDELSIAAGDIIELVHDDNQEWLGGQLNGAMGYFPRSFVTFLEDAPAPAEAVATTEQDFAELYPKARVVVAHTASDEGEISLAIGDTVAVFSWDSDYWWEGFIGETSGYFPNSCVEWIEPEGSDADAYAYYEDSTGVPVEESTQVDEPVVPAPVVAPTPVVVAAAPKQTPVVAKATTTTTPVVNKVAEPVSKPVAQQNKRELPSAPGSKPLPTPVAAAAVVAPAPVVAPTPVHAAPTPVHVAPVHVAPTPVVPPTPVHVAPVHVAPVHTPPVHAAPVQVAQPSATSTPSPSMATPTTSVPSSPSLTPSQGFDKLLQPIISELTKQLVEAHQKETSALYQKIADSLSHFYYTMTSTATVVSKATPARRI